MGGLSMENKSFEYQYCAALKDIVQDFNCTYQKNRTGIDTMVQQSVHFRMYDITNNFPILRGKKVYPLMALKELLWMLTGRTDVQWLRDRKVTYWDEWEQADGTIGKSYGYQFRNFNGIDNLNNLYIEMLENPLSRRHILNIWNVNNLNEMALPPCMYDYNFNCLQDNENNDEWDNGCKIDFYKVNLHAHIRSNDAFLGAPYDFMFCAWFNFITCMYLNWCVSHEPEFDNIKFYSGDVYYTADNFHLYTNHINQAKEYIHNVEENKFHIIDVPTYIQTENKEDLGPENYISYKDPENLNNFLTWIENYILKDKKITVSNKLREYGPIKADIAV